jgi:hypothetical protein
VQTPPKSKGKGIFGAIKGLNKRTQSDRSPEEDSSSKVSRQFSKLVGVIVPPAPLPHSSYTPYFQLGSRPSKSSSAAASSSDIAPSQSNVAPPLSTSPSLSSFESYGSNRNYEAERLQILLNASHEDLRIQAQHFDDERQLLLDQIKDLERVARGEGGSGSRRG